MPIRNVAATLLALLGLPAGAGMAAPPLPPVAPVAAPAVDYAARFREEIRARRLDSPPSPAAASEELAKLQALGYLGANEPARVGAGSGSRNPRSAGSFNNEGLILLQEGKRDEARAAFERALALDPGFASAEWNLSEILWSSGEIDYADELLISALRHGLGDGAVRAAPRFALRLQRGQAHLRARSCLSAADEFARAAAIEPDNSSAPAAEGLAWLCVGDDRKAEQAFRRSLKLDPRQPEIIAAVERLAAR
jgi:tetratricopeptide (TPR) repeat protein